MLKRALAGLLACLPLVAQTDLLSNQGGTAVPAMAWTSVLASGDLIGYISGNVDGCVYVQSLHSLACVEQFRSQSSEPNQNMFVYSLLENRNSLQSGISRFQSPYWAESGHPSGDQAIDPTTAVMYSFGMNSGAQLNGEGATKTTVSYDFNSGTAKQRRSPTTPQFNTAIQECAFDSWRRKLACWGGDGSSNQLQTFDPSTDTWTINPTLTGTCPATGLQSTELAFNSTDGNLYLFGGKVSGASNNNLYTINLGTLVCTQLSPSGPPGARGDAAWVYASRENKFVLFGGSVNSSNTCAGTTGQCYIDTWIYDPVANTWTDVTATVGTPTPTSSVGTVEYRVGYDAELDAIVCLPEPASGNSSQTFWYLRLQPGPNIGTLTLTHTPTTGGLNHDATAYAQLGPSLAPSGTSDLYVSFSQFGTGTTGNGIYPHTYIQDIGTGTTVNVPNPSTFSSFAADSTGTALEQFDSSVAVSGGLLWDCVDSLAGSTITLGQNCKSFSSGAWSGGVVTVLQPGLPSTSHIIGPSRIIDVGGQLTMVYRDNNRTITTEPNTDTVNVAQLISGTWTVIGTSLNNTAGSGGTNSVADSIAIVSDGAGTPEPYIAWTEYVGTNTGGPARQVYANTKVFLKHYNGSAWSLMCGGAGNISTSTGWAESVSLVMFNGNPTLSWTERVVGSYPRVYVRSCISGTWTSLGSGYLNEDQAYGWAFYTKLVPNGSSLYLTWDEQGNGTSWSTPPNSYESSASAPVHTYVDVWNGSTWSRMGGALNADTAYGAATWPDLVLYNSQPAVAWGEQLPNTNRTIYAKEYNATTLDFGPLSAGSSASTSSIVGGNSQVSGNSSVH